MGMISDLEWTPEASPPERTPKLNSEPPAKTYLQFESRRWNCYLCGNTTDRLMIWRDPKNSQDWRAPVCPFCAERWCDGPKTRVNLLETE